MEKFLKVIQVTFLNPICPHWLYTETYQNHHELLHLLSAGDFSLMSDIVEIVMIYKWWMTLTA